MDSASATKTKAEIEFLQTAETVFKDPVRGIEDSQLLLEAAGLLNAERVDKRALLECLKRYDENLKSDPPVDKEVMNDDRFRSLLREAGDVKQRLAAKGLEVSEGAIPIALALKAVVDGLKPNTTGKISENFRLFCQEKGIDVKEGM